MTLEQSIKDEIEKLERRKKMISNKIEEIRVIKNPGESRYVELLRLKEKIEPTRIELTQAKSNLKALQSARRKLEEKLKFVEDDDHIDIDNRGKMKKYISTEKALSTIKEVLGSDDND